MEFTNLDPLARRRRAKQEERKNREKTGKNREKNRMDLVRGLRASRVRLRGRPGAQPGGGKPHRRSSHRPEGQGTRTPTWCTMCLIPRV
mgnify:CR=1 FL=1